MKASGLAPKSAEAYATPRRLVLHMTGLAQKSADVMEERKGPRVGAPEQAIQGFLRGAGLKTVEEATVVEDGKKGSYYLARIGKPGRVTPAILAEVVPDVIAKFPWPKSMRWGSGTTRWVRPLQSIVCLFDGHVVPFEIEGVKAGDQTRGHRFHGNTPFAVKSFEDYGKKLKEHKVLLPAAERSAWIAEQAQALAAEHKLKLVEDQALLNENAGLNEWPTVLMGTFDKDFLAVPAECLMTSMKAHQKCFSVKDAKGKLANRFLCVSNLIAADGGKQIVEGNEKVIRARLSDAKFFWDQDLKRKLEPMRLELAGIKFHDKLGSASRAGRAHHGVGAPDRRRGRCRARSGGARGAAVQGRSRLGHGRRVPGIAGADGPLLRHRRAHEPENRAGLGGALQAEGGGRHACPRSRSRSRWRWPTSSTRWWGSGRSARSRRARAIPISCAARRWA